MKKVVVIGASGSGKTTLARQLATRTGLAHVEVDGLFWDPGWQRPPKEEFRRRVEAALAASPGWIVDGNYSAVRDLTWGRADTIVWLDYPLRVSFARCFRRTVKRLVTRERMFSGNRESWRTLLSKDSILLWAWESWRTYRASYPALLRAKEYEAAEKVRLTSQRETDAWLRRVSPACR